MNPSETAEDLRAEISRLRAEIDRMRLSIAALQVRDRATGLFDARETTRLTRLEIDRARRHGRVFSVLLARIVDYPGVVERWGGGAAQLLLTRVGGVCTAGRRLGDVVGRLDGGDFVVILPETPREATKIVAAYIKKANEGAAAPIEVADGTRVVIAVDLAFGISSFPDDAGDVDGLLLAARKAIAAA